MTVCAIVGAQYGSEGKGRIVQELAKEYGVHVRTGGPNAGHTIHHDGREWKMQVIPCGWINPNATLVIGAGATIDVEQLLKELHDLEEAGIYINDRLMIHSQASIVTQLHKALEGGVEGEIHKRIGSTGKGVGACRAARMRRVAPHMRAGDVIELSPYITDTTKYLNTTDALDRGILLEGTQGTGLSLTHGRWPFVTSIDTTVGQFMVDAGLAPSKLDRCILVTRTYPIRVAGNSGPMGKEITWEALSAKLGRNVTETTTVTKKTRRIGNWNETDFMKACQLNGPTEIAITFLDYLQDSDRGVDKHADLSDESKQFIEYLGLVAKVPVTFAGTGPKEEGCSPVIIRL